MKFVASLRATEATLADGRPLVGGEEYDLSPTEYQESHNARLIAENQLMAVNHTDKVREESAERLANSGPPTPPEPVADPPTPNGGTS